MDRRQFLVATSVGASGYVILGASSCAILPKLPAEPQKTAGPIDMPSYLARVDEGMDTIGRWSPSGSNAHPQGADLDELGRKSLRTLYLAAMFADLPREAQLHPDMQQRMWNALPEMDDAMAGVEQLLASRSDEDLTRLRSALRSPQNPAMEIFQALDRHAAACGVSRRRRLQMRAIVTDANWRLRNQPPRLVIDESLRKANKAAASDVSREIQEDRLAANLGERVFWEAEERAGGSDKSGSSSLPDSSVHHASKRHQRISRGAKLMGIGIVLGGASAALASSGVTPGIFAATVGAVLLLIGLITLLVGLATSGNQEG